MRRNLLAFTLLSSCAFATPALAEDSALIPYAGVLGGYDIVVARSGGTSGHKGGFAYGGVVGVDSSVAANTRLGIEAEIMGSTTRDGLTVDPLNTLKVTMGRDLFIGVRAGVFAAPKLLSYVKAGYANTRLKASGLDAGVAYSYATNLSGYRLAAGLEYGDRVRARLEYRFTDYGEVKYQGTGLDVDAQRHQIVLGAIYGF